MAVGANLTAADNDHLAQLFLEAHYIYIKEGKKSANSVIMHVLTDGCSWHLIKTDVAARPFEFKSLFTVSTKTQEQWDSNLILSVINLSITSANESIYQSLMFSHTVTVCLAAFLFRSPFLTCENLYLRGMLKMSYLSLLKTQWTVIEF